MPEANVGYLLCTDLLFTSRITGTARDLGLTIKAARSFEALQKLVAEQAPVCVLLDLSNPGGDVATLVRDLRTQCPDLHHVIAYGSHVDAATLRTAREAGCDLVLTRSKFVDELPRALPGWFQTPD
jgi:CheY-like chemotaxis protein